MPELNEKAVRLPVPGGKIIDEYVGLASTGERACSVAHIVAPPHWYEPYQTPAFDEHTVVLDGEIHVEHDGGQIVVRAGQSITTRAGERIRHSTRGQGAEYVAVCLPAFSVDTVGREDAAGDAGTR